MAPKSEVHEDDLEPSGDPQDQFYTYKGQPFSGICYSTHEDGRRSKEVEYVDGLPNGIWKRWYESGTLKSASTCQSGVKHGSHEEWHDGGPIKLRATYEYGIQVEVTEWDTAGRMIRAMQLGPDSPGANWSILMNFRARAKL